ncbi:MAG: DUF1801 domain-containing protein [Actinomycetes bacterium]
MADKVDSVRQYIDALPPEIQDRVIDIRSAILQQVAGAEEKLAYGIPTVTLGGKNLISYAVWKTHIGVYPIPVGDESFQARIEPFRESKATARFPLDKPVPLGLIAEMATLLAAERGPS